MSKRLRFLLTVNTADGIKLGSYKLTINNMIAAYDENDRSIGIFNDEHQATKAILDSYALGNGVRYNHMNLYMQPVYDTHEPACKRNLKGATATTYCNCIRGNEHYYHCAIFTSFDSCTCKATARLPQRTTTGELVQVRNELNVVLRHIDIALNTSR